VQIRARKKQQRTRSLGHRGHDTRVKLSQPSFDVTWIERSFAGTILDDAGGHTCTSELPLVARSGWALWMEHSVPEFQSGHRP
jgi:hypothetical protein